MNFQQQGTVFEGGTLAEELAVELSEAEIEEVSGGIWTTTDTGLSCDGPVFVK